MSVWLGRRTEADCLLAAPFQSFVPDASNGINLAWLEIACMFGYLVSELDDRLRANGNVVEVTRKRISFSTSEAKSRKMRKQ